MLKRQTVDLHSFPLPLALFFSRTDSEGPLEVGPDSGVGAGSWLEWKTFKRRFPYYMPILLWLPRYDIRKDLIYDVFAGIAVAAMVVPQSLALAILAGLDPIYGLYSTWVCASQHSLKFLLLLNMN